MFYDKFSKIKTDYILKKEKDHYETQHIESIRLGDIVVINSETIIPFDGIVASGDSIINSKVLLGEDKSSIVYVGDKVYSGCYNERDTISIKVAYDYYESNVYKIMKFVEGTPRKSKIERT